MYQEHSTRTFEKLKAPGHTVGMDMVHIEISLTNLKSSKTRYKETKMKEIISASCALLNSNGGNVVVHIKDKNSDRDVLVQNCIRMIEQRLMDIIGSSTMVSNISFEKSGQQIVLCIARSSSFITTNYNLYIPSETQVVLVLCMDHVEKVKEAILNRKVVVNPIKIGSHQKEFVKDQNCGLREGKNVRFKNLKSVSSKCVTLADRIINKSNKLSCYVSAFANHSGGHIYYGVTDDGTVEGEVITNSENIDEITKKVTKTMNKLIWPDYIGKPQRGEQWDIFFHPVHDNNSTPVPSTYVIVIYVAPCIGGVFTEQPESYAMIDGQVDKMTFPEWKSKMVDPITAIQSRKHGIPSGVQRCTWSSPRIEKACTDVNTLLMPYINNGNWGDLFRFTKELQMRYTDSEVKLAVLSKQVTAYYRRGLFNKANECLEVYNRVLPTSKNVLIFEVIGLYLQAAMERSQGKFETSYKHLTDGLCMVEQIPAGLISAAFYSLTATLKGIKDCTQNPTVTTSSTAVEDEKPEILSTKALEHLQGVDESPTLRVDMEQKAHINLALLYLGCSLSGDLLTTVDVDDECIAKANSSLMAVNQSVCEGYTLSLFRKIQFNFAMSILHYRRSKAQQLVHSKRVRLLQSAFNSAKKAEKLARECNFVEMVTYSQKCLAICTEDLVRIHSLRPKSREIFGQVFGNNTCNN